MISRPLDELYLEWLYSQVAEVSQKARARTYWSLFRELYCKEFIWLIPNDDNRVADGKDLRREFVQDADISDVDRTWLDLNCSFLEMLIGLSRRLAFELDGEPRKCFWDLLVNLELDRYTDRVGVPAERVHDIVDTVIWRQYDYNGRGGLFPLQHPERDQANAEIWYQLNAYIIEQDL